MDISSKYKIIEVLGQQQKRKFGKVFRVENKVTGEQFVMKTNIEGAQNQTEIELLKKENEYSFDFPGLPQVVDTYQLDKEYFLIKKFQHGVHLDIFWSKLKKKEQLPFLINFLERINPILNHLHQQEIYHCDLKPSNILIDGTTEDFNVEIIDFGLAYNKTNPDSRKLIFPLGFAAPELILNKLNFINTTTDYFALGIIIWRLFTGKLPLAHPNPSIFTNLQLVHPLPEHDSISKGILKILRKMASKPEFKNSPNNMNSNEVETCLIEAINHRYKNLDSIISELKALPRRKKFGLF